MEGSLEQTTKLFFDACETGKGWEICKQYCLDNATFSAQSEPLANLKTIEEYTEWMKGFATTTTLGCTYEIKCWATNETQSIVYAVFRGTHNGEGGPCPPTMKSTVSDYVYILDTKEGKISNMVKVWNAPWAMKDFGWC